MADLSKYTDEQLQDIAGGAAQMPTEELEVIANQEAPDYVQEQGVFDSTMIGAGKTLTDLGRGAQKLYYGATDDKQALGELKAKADEEQGWYDQLANENPWSTMAGEMLPYLATAPLSGGLMTQAGVGAVGEGLRYGKNQGAQGIMGGAMSMGGYGVGRMAPRIMGAIKGAAQSNKQALRSLTEGQQRLVGRADELGYKLKPGQRLQSKPLQQIERSAESMPFTSGLTEGMEKENQALLNRLALESIGEVGEDIRGNSFANAADRIGDVYDNSAKSIGVIDLNQKVMGDMFDDMSVEGEKYIAAYVKKYPSLAEGRLTGVEFNKLSSKVERDIRNAFVSNPGVADDLIDFKSHMHTMLMKASPKDAEKLKVAGKQWKNLKALESGNSVTKGNVNPRTLSSKLNRIDKGGFKRERNLSDYYDTVRIADELGGISPNSETATRNWFSQIAANPTAVPGGMALRAPYKKYLESGGSPAYANLLGAYPDTSTGQLGAAVGRGSAAAEFPELAE